MRWHGSAPHRATRPANWGPDAVRHGQRYWRGRQPAHPDWTPAHDPSTGRRSFWTPKPSSVGTTAELEA
ncbi:hypothetical protein GGTG_06429 [Gaeumannomyces tritici R3-111a-1]|uniref:Uncharacterized protein n=1 Tax=Gaeumannomyces tritici (strain R3-111a-1) TaxID=644352 RepID=J3NYS7_GAET3|nr:hypothetical protein GGTG_06429 [Gaeumannomyces tritici R3-111a-1]EJT76510.1 hypothetical protein GGTG_06429 [Gaeumannomyces tritici R3-111a-1]